MTLTTKLFQFGNSQAVRLPEAFRFDCRETEILRRGDEVILRSRRRNLAPAFDCIAELPEDMINALERRENPLPEEREAM